MKYGYAVKKNGVLYMPGMEVPGAPSAKVEATDKVPDGALATNADGSVNASDTEGNVVGTVDAENVAELKEQARESLQEEDKPKRGRKPKEE